MRKFFLAAVWFFSAAGPGFATDPAIPLTVTSGFNADLIADGTNSAGSSTTGGFDGAASVFYDSTYDGAHGNHGGAVPAGQTINDAAGNLFSLAPATGNNALLIGSGNPSGTLNLSYPPNASLTGLLLLGTSAEGATILDYTLNFAGGVTSSGSFTFSDWFNPGASGTFNSFGRISLADEFNGETGRAFSLYTADIAIPVEDASLQLQSITLAYAAANVDRFGVFPRAAIFGVSAFDPIITPVPEPSSSSFAFCGALALAVLGRRKFFKN